jgi:iron complex transport system substrate-binding protein
MNGRPGVAPRLVVATVVVAVPSLVAGCGGHASPGPDAGPAAVVVHDGLGREVRLKRAAGRVVSLAPSMTEILYTLDAGERVVGRDERSDFPPAARAAPSVGTTYPKSDVERVVALEPDLVLTAGEASPADLETFASLGLPTYSSGLVPGLEAIYHDIVSVGRLVGRAAEAERLAGALRARVARVTTAARASHGDGVSVFFALGEGDPARPWTAGPGSFIDDLLGRAGAVNVGRTGETAYFQMSLERIVAANPDLVMVSVPADATGAAIADRLRRLPGWSALEAVSDGRVFAVDEDLLLRPGPRVVEGLEVLARAVAVFIQARGAP